MSAWRRCSVLAVTAAAVIVPASIRAAEPRDVERQTREFSVAVDGTPRGKCVIDVRRRDDGSDLMRIDSSLRFNYYVYTYTYTSKGTELWQDGRLVDLDNRADFNGTKFHVQARAAEGALAVSVNGKKAAADADAWVTSYWRLPEALLSKDRTGKVIAASATVSRPAAAAAGPMPVALLDSDKGRSLKARLQRVGDEFVTAAGKRVSSTHYRVSGDAQADLWYDSSGRLVRQETVESGHRTLLELTRLADGP